MEPSTNLCQRWSDDSHKELKGMYKESDQHLMYDMSGQPTLDYAPLPPTS